MNYGNPVRAFGSPCREVTGQDVIDVWWECDCLHGPQPFAYHTEMCQHRWTCKWGPIGHSCPRPDRGEVEFLMITTTDYVAALLRDGPTTAFYGGTHTVTMDADGKLYARLDFEGSSWVWELYPARLWEHGKLVDFDGFQLMIGRWPD